MLTLHVTVCFIALLAGALVLIALWGGRRQPTWDAVLLLSTALVCLTGFPLASPPGTPTPDPARILGVMELVIVVIAALALYVGHLAGAWRGIYIVAIVLAVYFNVFVAVAQAFLKIGFLHAFAPTGKEPPFLIAQLLTLALFVVIELEVDHPLLDLRVFQSRAYTVSLIAMSVMMTGLFATLFYVPLFLQAGQGYPALNAGLLIFPQALVMGFLMPIAGRLYDRIGPRWLAVTGLLIAAYGSYLLAGINPDMTRSEIVLWTCIRAGGVGLAMMPIMTGGIASLSHDLTTTGSAINTVAQRVSAALGLAALTAMATTQQAQLAAGRTALLQADSSQVAHLNFAQFYGLYRQTQLAVLANSYSNVFLLTAATTVLAALIALLLRSGPAEHSESTAVPME